MRCVSPFVKAGRAYSCGNCLPCKFMKRREWSRRILLEASQHDYSSVVTLTYDPSALPLSEELQPSHLRDWLKRYRKRQLERYPWRYLRFFACAEYGESTQRPHYHVVLFGQPGCERSRGGQSWCGDCGCVTCSDVVETWSLGVSSIDQLTPASASYVSGYVTRKLKMVVLPGKRMPFLRMSNRPGIGASAMQDVASVILQYGLEMPPPLWGRYCRLKLAEAIDGDVPEISLEKMRMVRDYAFVNSISQREVFRQINEHTASQLQQREALQRGSL